MGNVSAPRGSLSECAEVLVAGRAEVVVFAGYPNGVMEHSPGLAEGEATRSRAPTLGSKSTFPVPTL